MLVYILAFSQNFPPKIGTAKRTSKCTRMLTNITSRKGFFDFSHQNVPNIRQSVSNPVACVPVQGLGCPPSGSSYSRPAWFQLQARPAEQLPLESGEMSKSRVKFSTLYSLQIWGLFREVGYKWTDNTNSYFQ